METLVATVLLMLVFMVTSLIMNTLFGNALKYDTDPVVTYMNTLEYRYYQQQLQLPYTETYQDWEIRVFNHTQDNIMCITFEAVHLQHHKTVTKTRIAHVAPY